MPHAVVDQLRDPDLEALLLAREVTFERDPLEILVRHDQREGCRALVDLAALDADAAVLDQVGQRNQEQQQHTHQQYDAERSIAQQGSALIERQPPQAYQAGPGGK